MTTYKEAGVDVEMGDRCSRIAYNAAKGTFHGRKGMVGEALVQDGGYTGMLNMGSFYLVQNDDGVGTKIEVAEKMRKFKTLGYDLVAMVADDAICVGAEVFSITNTLDVPKMDEKMITDLMEGLKEACLEQKIVVPGGELAELPGSLNHGVWNATAVGLVEKNKVINGSEIHPSDVIIGLPCRGIRSNGLSLARSILKQHFGEYWENANYDDDNTWGDIILRPSVIYHRALLNLIGGYGQERRLNIKGLAHITGGGIPGNLPRILEDKGLGADLTYLPAPYEFMLRLQKMGDVSDEEAYQVWNMGIGMMVVVDQDDVERALNYLGGEGLNPHTVGMVSAEPGIHITSQGHFKQGEVLDFK